MGVSKQSVSRYVNDQREMDYATIRKIVAIFNVTSEYLLGIDRNEEKIAESVEELSTREFRIPLVSHFIGEKPFLSDENVITYFRFACSVFGAGNFFFYRLGDEGRLYYHSAISQILLDQYVLIRRREKFFNGDVLAIVLEGSEKINIRRIKIKDTKLYFDLNGLGEELFFTIDDVGKRFRVIGKVISLIAAM
ncbi:hypothetical protein AZF37_09005 [endosymbiont 'TC1' of Trimyema compressum]|nr:hypothetical protein AZF37_09005 [endosymbiont 'TC1' of Trimyema compressum]